MKKIASFRRYWNDVGQKINVIASTRGAQVVVPEADRLKELGNNLFELSFSSPTFIYNTPQRGSSSKASHRYAIFVDGTFTVYEDDEAGTQLTDASCNLSVFESEDIANESYKLRLLEAMHFDMEGDPQSEFHPIFHAQRGRSNSLTSDRIVACVQRIMRLEADKIHIEDGAHLALPCVRVPTPPMDYLSVLATVVADFLCSPDQAKRDVKDAFNELLKMILGVRNLMRDVRQSRRLLNRWNGGGRLFASGHWYQESV